MSKEKYFIRVDENTHARYYYAATCLCRELNDCAVPLFNEFNIPVSIESVLKYCVKGGKEILMAEIKESFGTKFSLVKNFSLKMLSKYPNFPQYELNDAQRLHLSLIIPGKRKVKKNISENGVLNHYNEEVFGFVPNNATIEDYSKVYISSKYQEDHDKLMKICKDLTDLFGHNTDFNYDATEILFVDAKTGTVTPDWTMINDGFYETLAQFRKEYKNK